MRLLTIINSKFDRLSELPIIFKWVVLVGLIILIILTSFLDFEELFLNRNYLKLGERAVAEQDIELVEIITGQAPISYERLHDTRIQRLQSSADLLLAEYEPRKTVFRRIDTLLPWWSEEGFYVTGQNKELAPGKPAAAFGLVNPLLLVMPEFWSLTHWFSEGNRPDLNKRKALNDATATNDADQYQLTPRPKRLTWNAQKRHAVAYYDVSAFYEKNSKYWLNPQPLLPITIGIYAYNARDFALRYINLDNRNSENIINQDERARITKIQDRFEASSVCGNTEGCNHVAMPIPWFSNLVVEKLPAKIAFNLWSSEEATSGNPEFLYLIVIE